MADIASGDVTYTEKAGTACMAYVGRERRLFTVAFGNGVLTYGTGGIPLLGSKFGFPAGVVEEVAILDLSDDGSPTGIWTWDEATNKLRGFDFAGSELTGALDATSLYVKAIGY